MCDSEKNTFFRPWNGAAMESSAEKDNRIIVDDDDDETTSESSAANYNSETETSSTRSASVSSSEGSPSLHHPNIVHRSTFGNSFANAIGENVEVLGIFPSTGGFQPIAPTAVMAHPSAWPYASHSFHWLAPGYQCIQEAVHRIKQQDAVTRELKKLRPKRFKCNVCNVAFSNNGQLKGHLRIHTGERPFKCEAANCGKSFTRNEELTRHKRIHTGLRPYLCQVCSKGFGRKDHLKKHTKTHENKNAYQIAAAAAAAAAAASVGPFVGFAAGPAHPHHHHHQHHQPTIPANGYAYAYV